MEVVVAVHKSTVRVVGTYVHVMQTDYKFCVRRARLRNFYKWQNSVAVFQTLAIGAHMAALHYSILC